MDFLKAGCKIAYLHKDEIAHELAIRSLPVNPLSRRDSLHQALKQTADLARSGNSNLKTLVARDPSSELDTCQRKAEEIESEIKDNLPLAASTRLISRCRYLLCRLSRISSENANVDLLKSMIETMVERLSEDNASAASPSDSEDEDRTPDRSPQVVREIVYKNEKTFNLNSLNLKYRGDSCARTFITRLEELRVARRIPESVVLRGLPEILEGPALSWFRSNHSDFASYRDVLNSLREDFDIPDLDYKLLQEIRARTQGRDETIVVFVSIVLGMFERLNTNIPEAEKLDILMRNIRPEYSKELALQDITSIRQLKTLCKRIELAKVKADNFREPTTSMAKDTSSSIVNKPYQKGKFHFSRSPSTSKNFVSAVAQSTSKQACFRCGLSNHTTRTCQKSRDIVCFKCGEKGVRTPDCPKCNPNTTPKN